MEKLIAILKIINYAAFLNMYKKQFNAAIADGKF